MVGFLFLKQLIWPLSKLLQNTGHRSSKERRKPKVGESEGNDDDNSGESSDNNGNNDNNDIELANSDVTVPNEPDYPEDQKPGLFITCMPSNLAQTSLGVGVLLLILLIKTTVSIPRW